MSNLGGIFDASGRSGADGIAFVIQNDAAAPIGEAGGQMGYGGIKASVAIEFDTFQNPEHADPSANHVSIQSRGATANDAGHQYSRGSVSPLVDFSDGAVHTARIEYVPGTLRVYLDAATTPVLTAPLTLTNVAGGTVLDSSGRAWVGFTSATGNAWEVHDLLSWTLTPQP
jgi:hypothetical protein